MIVQVIFILPPPWRIFFGIQVATRACMGAIRSNHLSKSVQNKRVTPFKGYFLVKTFLVLGMGSHHRQVVILVSADKLYCFGFNGFFMLLTKRSSFLSRTSAAA